MKFLKSLMDKYLKNWMSDVEEKKIKREKHLVSI